MKPLLVMQYSQQSSLKFSLLFAREANWIFMVLDGFGLLPRHVSSLPAGMPSPMS
jgi:hypothetical protein